MTTLKVTKIAKEMLEDMLRKGGSEHGYSKLIPAILWMGDAEGKNFDWGIGFYEKSRIVADWIVTLSDMQFYIDPADLPKLDGQILDYVGNRFKILTPQHH